MKSPSNRHHRLFIIVSMCVIVLCIIIANNIRKGSGYDDVSVGSNRSVDAVQYDDNQRADSSKVDKDFFAGSISAAETDTMPPSAKTIVVSNGISARAYVAANVKTGEIYASKNVNEVLPVASMSKLVTAFAATDMLPSTTTITITKEETSVYPDSSGITAGETYTLDELLYPLLLNSSNIAAEALASTTNRTNFLELMSSYAWEIGMDSAYFADPSGLDPLNAASANDLLALAKYLYGYRPDILALTRVASTSVATTTDHGSHNFISIHPFVNNPDFIGGKTGRTPQAGDTMLTIIMIDSQPIAIVVLGSDYDGRARDTALIIALVKKKMAK